MVEIEKGRGPKDTPTEQLTASAPSTSKIAKKQALASTPSGMKIARSKHWRFVSSFHGSWLSLPIGVLRTVANLNYKSPRPRPMDPAVVFDVLEIRRNLEEATNFAVGAATDVASSTLVDVNGNVLQSKSDGRSTKLSGERKLRMRETACQKLARAYELDEIASSMAMMQGASALETVGSLVLQRKQDNLDAKYCHFFLEKIPAGQLATCTSLEPLTDIISSGAAHIAALRTRAMVKIRLEDLDGGIDDVTEALRHARYLVGPFSHSSAPNEPSPSDADRRRRFRDPSSAPSQDEQPTGLIQQLYLQRAMAYLFKACRSVASCLPSAGEDESEETSRTRRDCRVHVKSMAKRALKDYTTFISHFDYSPNFGLRFDPQLEGDILAASEKIGPYSVEYATTSKGHTVYSVSELFTAIPPTDLPEYPPPPDAPSDGGERPAGVADRTAATREIVTYHPLLTEALHAILLCHCLLQTSTKELQRHAYMVARLVRLCRGEPFFREIRTISRSDWVETLRLTENWIHLSDTWEALCTPKLLFSQEMKEELAQQNRLYAAAASLRQNGSSSAAPDKLQPTEPPCDWDSRHPTTSEGRFSLSDYSAENKDFPSLTLRASAVADWIREVPPVVGMTRKKKKCKKASMKDDTGTKV